MKLNYDCRHFLGHIPCRPHKKEGVHCEGCRFYDPADFKILIIKLGAIGDVIRTTPLLHRLREEYPRAFITWLTCPPTYCRAWWTGKWASRSRTSSRLLSQEFDLLVNLDKDLEAVGIANQVNAKAKKGFMMVDGKCRNIDEASYDKYLTGLWDDVNKANTKSYPEEIFEICGYKFAGEKYILELPIEKPDFDIPEGARVVGLNTGCGGRWVTRLWEDNRWAELAGKLKEAGYYPLFLGGEQEHVKKYPSLRRVWRGISRLLSA